MPTIYKPKRKSRNSDKSKLRAKLYSDTQYRKIRDWYYQCHPLCEMCLNRDISRPDQHVHHKKEFLKGSTDEERWKLLLDYDNLQSLCLDCHHKVHHHRK